MYFYRTKTVNKETGDRKLALEKNSLPFTNPHARNDHFLLFSSFIESLAYCVSYH